MLLFGGVLKAIGRGSLVAFGVSGELLNAANQCEPFFAVASDFFDGRAAEELIDKLLVKSFPANAEANCSQRGAVPATVHGRKSHLS